jgi:branched-chain amino acid transport system substrate-binding protein
MLKRSMTPIIIASEVSPRRSRLVLRSVWMLLVLGALLALLAAGAPSAAEDRKSPFKAGIILPLSGPLAEYGAAFRNGVAMAKEDYPKLFNDVSLTYEDSQYDPKTAISAFEKLRREGVSLMFVWGNAPSEAVCPLSERYRVPTIASISNPAVSIQKQYTIRAVNHAASLSRLLAGYLREKGYSSIGVVLTEISYLNAVLSGLRAELASSQSLELIDAYGPADNDFRASVTKIRSAHYDVIGVLLISGQISQFYRQAAEHKLDVPTFGTDFFESTTEIAQSKGTMEGAVYVHFNVDHRFRRRYLEKFGNDIQLAYAGNGYDMSMVIAQAAAKASKDPEETMEALRLKGPQQGVGGVFRYRETDEGGAYFEFPIHIKQIHGKEFRVIKSGS